MHELFPTTWSTFLQEYYNGIEAGGTTLVECATALSEKTQDPISLILRKYGRSILINYIHPYFQATTTQDLLTQLQKNQNQVRHTVDIFLSFRETPLPGGILLTYDKHWQLCPALWGIVEGCAIQFQETIAIAERACIRQGNDICLFEIYFLKSSKQPHKQHQKIVELMLTVLPEDQQFTLGEVSIRLRRHLKYTIDFGVLKNVITQNALVVTSTPGNEEWKVSRIASRIGNALVIHV